jgi:hypothetical protein
MDAKNQSSPRTASTRLCSFVTVRRTIGNLFMAADVLEDSNKGEAPSRIKESVGPFSIYSLQDVLRVSHPIHSQRRFMRSG